MEPSVSFGHVLEEWSGHSLLTKQSDLKVNANAYFCIPSKKREQKYEALKGKDSAEQSPEFVGHCNCE